MTSSSLLSPIILRVILRVDEPARHTSAPRRTQHGNETALLTRDANDSHTTLYVVPMTTRLLVLDMPITMGLMLLATLMSLRTIAVPDLAERCDGSGHYFDSADVDGLKSRGPGIV
jgi:hypothetical protein